MLPSLLDNTHTGFPSSPGWKAFSTLQKKLLQSASAHTLCKMKKLKNKRLKYYLLAVFLPICADTSMEQRQNTMPTAQMPVQP